MMPQRLTATVSLLSVASFFIRLAEGVPGRLEVILGRKFDTATLGPKIRIYISSAVTVSYAWRAMTTPGIPNAIGLRSICMWAAPSIQAWSPNRSQTSGPMGESIIKCLRSCRLRLQVDGLASRPEHGGQSMRHRSRTRFILEGIEGVVVLGSVLCTWPLSRRWLKDWGSRRQERARRWPGDRFVSPDHEEYTRAISVSAPAGTVWGWVAQFGLGRAGFYSYELLERIAGIPVTNVESVEPAMQSVAVGDEIRLHPKAPGIPIADLQPGRHICFGAHYDPDSKAARPDPARSWSIYVEPVAADSCRLLLRGCIEKLRDPSWSKRLALALQEPVDFVMEQRMLRTIKRLAESSRR